MGFLYTGHKDPQVRKLFRAIQAVREEEERQQANGETEDEKEEDDEEEEDQDEEADDDEPDAQAELALDAAYGEEDEDGDAEPQTDAPAPVQRGRTEAVLDSQQDAQVVKTPEGHLLRRARSKTSVDRLSSQASYVGKLLTKEEEELARMLEEIRLMEGYLGHGDICMHAPSRLNTCMISHLPYGFPSVCEAKLGAVRRPIRCKRSGDPITML